MKVLRILAPSAAVAGLLLSGCADPTSQREASGTVLGGLIGGVLGSQVGKGKGRLVATAVGATAGALIGGDIGRALDRADRAAMHGAAQRALEASPSGRVSTWRNPDSGNSGTITPRPVYRGGSGEYCREYQQTITVGGRTETAYGTACRQPDGAWKIQS